MAEDEDQDDTDYPYSGPGGDGQLRFEIQVEPASLQSRAAARREFDDALREHLEGFEFVIDSQVSIDVHWYGVPRLRR